MDPVSCIIAHIAGTADEAGFTAEQLNDIVLFTDNWIPWELRY